MQAIRVLRRVDTLQNGVRIDAARQRQLLRMNFEQNKTVTEIAQELGVNKSTVSRTLLRAKRRLYQCLRYAL